MEVRHWALLAALALAGCDGLSLPGGKTKEPTLPDTLTGRIVDVTDAFTPEQEARFSDKLAAIEAETQVQFVIVTAPSLEGQNIATFTQELGNRWGVGDDVRNDGLILLIAPYEREVRIEVGEGLETQITDEEAQKVIDDMLPYFQEGQFEEAIEMGIDNLGAEVRPAAMKEAA